MRSGVMTAMAAVLVLGACSTVRDSRINPLNWFGASEPRAAVVETPRGKVVAPDGGRIPVAEVTELHVEQATGGAIIRAKGVPPSQGWYKAQLVQESSADGEMVFRFVLMQPPAGQRQGTPVSREVTVATFVNDFKLEGVHSITVTGVQSARSLRRH